MIDVPALKAAFHKEYGTEARVFFAPGRVNLIGDHTDYNDGWVLPMAIDRGTAVAIARNKTRRVRARSLQSNERVEFELDEPGKPRQGGWRDYVEGMAQQLLLRGVELVGCDLLVTSDLPFGAGLSSSAALEVGVGLALWTLAGGTPNKRELALAGQAAEQGFVGVNCGIMDQFTSVLGHPQHALLIDCRSLVAQSVPMRTKNMSVVVIDSRVRHKLSASPYNQRREECLQALQILRTRLPEARALRDIGIEDFRRFASLLPPTLRRRSRHVITENARTRKAAEALAQRDWTVLGQLMFASHESLMNDYEVSCKELDTLVEAVAGRRGVIGGRMTGAGFGGCTVNLVADDEVEELQQVVSDIFQREFQTQPWVYVTRAEAGAREL